MFDCAIFKPNPEVNTSNISIAIHIDVTTFLSICHGKKINNQKKKLSLKVKALLEVGHKISQRARDFTWVSHSGLVWCIGGILNVLAMSCKVYLS